MGNFSSIAKSPWPSKTGGQKPKVLHCRGLLKLQSLLWVPVGVRDIPGHIIMGPPQGIMNIYPLTPKSLSPIMPVSYETSQALSPRFSLWDCGFRFQRFRGLGFRARV